MCVLFCCLVILFSGRVVYAVPRIHACWPSPRIMFPISDVCTPSSHCPVSRHGLNACRIQLLSCLIMRQRSGLSYCSLPFLAVLFSGTPFTPPASCRKGRKKAARQCAVIQKPLWGRISQQRITWRTIYRVDIVTARLAQRQTGWIECVATQSLPQVWTAFPTMWASVNWRCLRSGLVVFSLPHLLRTRRLPFLRVTNIHIYVYVYIYCILRQYISITYDKLSLLSSVRSATGVLLSGVAPSEPIWSACNHKTFFSAPTRRPESDI